MSQTREETTRRERSNAGRITVVTAALVAVLATAAFIVGPTTTGGNAVATTPGVTTTTTTPAVIFALQHFPVQGICGFGDTWGAARSGGRTHEGVDIIAKEGQYVYAVADGTLTKQYLASSGGISGNGWRLQKADKSYFFYAHLVAFAPGLGVGSKVVAGQVIGYIGKTGNTTTPHLHFEIHPLGGAAISPYASVKAVDACKTTAPPQIPGVSVPAVYTSTSTSTATTVTPTTTGATTATTVKPPTTTTPPTPTTPPVTTPVPTTIPQTTARNEVVVGGAGAFRSLGRWRFIAPAVVLASSSRNVTAGVTKRVSLAGHASLTATTTGVLVRVSGYPSSGSGSLAVHACTDPAPTATALSLSAVATSYAPIAVAASNAEICVTSSVTAAVRLEVIAQQDMLGLGVAAISPVRAFDSRTTSRLVANTDVVITPAMLGIPVDAAAVEATFTVVGAPAAGALSVAPCGGTAWQAAYIANATTAVSSIIRVNATGLCLRSSTTADIIVDVSGYFSSKLLRLQPVNALRRFDSRQSAQVGAAPVTVQVAGIGEFPVSTPAAMIDVTMIGGSLEGSLFVWSCGQPMPNAALGVVRARSVNTVSALVPLSSGTICVASTQPMHVVVDVVAFGV